MERKSKFYIPVVRDKENGSWAYRGAAGKKETLENIEALRKMGVEAKDVDIIPVVEPRKDQALRTAIIIGTALEVLDLGIRAWRYLKKKRDKGTTEVSHS
jgi:hypothetical protein